MIGNDEALLEERVLCFACALLARNFAVSSSDKEFDDPTMGGGVKDFLGARSVFTKLVFVLCLFSVSRLG